MEISNDEQVPAAASLAVMVMGLGFLSLTLIVIGAIDVAITLAHLVRGWL
jgi:hypothetical protein